MPVADALSSLVSVPPFGILEPPTTYADGDARADGEQIEFTPEECV